MPETPDFDQIAQKARLAFVTADGNMAEIEIFVEALRLVWNARGAADIAKLDTELSTLSFPDDLMDPNMAGPYVKNLDRALRSLDR